MTDRRTDAPSRRKGGRAGTAKKAKRAVAGGCLAAGLVASPLGLVGCGGAVSAAAHDAAATDAKQPVADSGKHDAPIYALMAPVDASEYDGPVYALMAPMDAGMPDAPVYALMAPVDAGYDGPIYALMPPMDAG
jgi:hypothetical protein